MLESMVEWMGFPLYYAYDDAPQPPRAGAAHATIFPYGPFPVGDGHTVMLGLQNEREWAVFCDKVLFNSAIAVEPMFVSNSKRVENRDVLRQHIVDAFSSLTIEEVTTRLEAAQIANARVNQMKDVWDHPQLKARQRWVDVASPVGMLSALKPPASNLSFEARIDAIPALGEHTDAILAEVGCSPEQVAKLRQAGAI
jgi:itaconate CoA-transferase